MILKTLVLFLFSAAAMAAPRSLEVWFLSNSKTTQIDELLNRSQFKFYSRTAELQCQPMGDHCFDPQYGLYKKDDSWNPVEPGKIQEESSKGITARGAVDRDLINCDPNNFFDLFCGKARKEKRGKAKLELWIDTSSSMKEFDFMDKEGGCYRKSLVRRLDQDCAFNQKVDVMMFDTSIKEAGSMDQLCLNQGLNDSKRLIDWIERSEAQKLVIITDIYEFTKDLADYIESKNGIIKGDKDALTAAQLLELVDHLATSCR